jgi:type II secretory pathway component PulC
MAVEAERVIVAQAGVREELPLTPAPTVKKPVSSKKKVPPTIVVAVPEPEKVNDKEPQVIQPRVEPTVVPVPSDKVPVFTPAPARSPEPPQVVPAAPAEPTELKMTLARAELDRELTDFDKLMTTVSVTEVDGGGFKLTRVDGKSYVHKLGLRGGDVVVSVAGQQVSNVDDAARVYARLRTAKSFVVEVDRAGARVTMRYDVK